MAQKKKTVRRGHKLNSCINHEWGCVKRFGKQKTSHKRRQRAKREIQDRLINE